MEQQGLDENKLNELDTEPDTEPQPITIGQGEPISFRECVKFSNNGTSIEIYSSTLTADRLAGIILELLENNHSTKSKDKSYLN